MNTVSKNQLSINLLNLVTGYWKSQAINVAAKLGIADILSEGPKTCAEIAAATGAHENSIYRLLRALASIGIFSEISGRQFQLTPMAELLRSDTPDSMRSFALAICGPPFRAWAEADYSVRTGAPAFDQAYGESFFDYLSKHEDEARCFDDCMTLQSRLAHSAVVASYDFSSFGTVVDIGGGHGTLLELVLRENPQACGILFDLPHVVKKAKTRLTGSDIVSRVQFVEGSFFEAVPSDGDVYMMAMVIHDWSDEKALDILKTCHKHMRAHATLLLSELVIPAGNYPFFGKFLDLDMMINFGGKERTAKEYTELLERAGFEAPNILPAYGPFSALSILESRRL